MQRIKNTFKKKWVWALIVIVVFVVAYLIFRGGGKATGLEVQAVTKRDVSQIVSETGTVKASKDVNLSFLASGQVSSVHVKEGDTVKAGQVLATLKSSSQAAQVAQARSSLDAQMAQLNKLQAGVTSVDQTSLQTTVASAKTALAQTKSNLQTTQSVQDLQVKNARQKLYSNDLRAYVANGVNESSSFNSQPPTISGTYTGSETGEYDIDIYRSSTNSGYSFQYSGLESGIGSAKTNGTVPLGTRGLYIQFPTGYANADELKYVVPIPNTRSATYVAVQSAYEQAVQNRQTAIMQAQDKVQSAQDALNSAQAKYNQSVAPARSEDLQAQQASVAGARASLEAAQAGYSNTIITAPFSGTITNVSAKVGEVSSPGAPAISMISANNYEVDVNIPEADITNVTVGDMGTTTFDAYSNAKFAVKVVSVAPNATDVNGVTTVKTTLEFLKTDSRIKPGLSANNDIKAAEAKNVLAVLGRAVIQTDQGDFVRILKAGVDPSGTINPSQVKLISVNTGLKGSDGYVEITSGLKAGDNVVTFIPPAMQSQLDTQLANKTSSTSTANPATKS
jgi:HlyD family secretion protein